MMEPFSPPVAWFWPPGVSSQGVGRSHRHRRRVLAESIKKEIIIYFYSLSVKLQKSLAHRRQW
jgi:hypothetical protein